MAGKQLMTRAQVQQHNSRQSARIIIDNLVYEITEFLMEHPGGIDVLLDNAGKDASRCFHEVGHSEIAIDWRNKFLVGELVEEDQRPVEKRAPPPEPPVADNLSLGAMLSACGPPAMLAIIAALFYMYFF